MSKQEQTSSSSFQGDVMTPPSGLMSSPATAGCRVEAGVVTAALPAGCRDAASDTGDPKPASVVGPPYEGSQPGAHHPRSQGVELCCFGKHPCSRPHDI